MGKGFSQPDPEEEDPRQQASPVTSLEDRLYLALLGARSILSATSNVNPAALPRLALVDRALEAYKLEKAKDPPPVQQELAHAAGE